MEGWKKCNDKERMERVKRIKGDLEKELIGRSEENVNEKWEVWTI